MMKYLILLIVIFSSTQANWLDDAEKNRLENSGQDEIFYIVHPKNPHQADNVQPRHVHLSRKFDNTMTITWSTIDVPNYSFVEYGATPETLQNIQKGKTDVLNSRDYESENRQFIHEVTLLDLIPGQSYYYRCVSKHTPENSTLYSKTYKFKMSPEGTTWSPKLIIFGDLGAENPVSLPYMTEDVDTETYDAIFHIGDFAYNMNTGGGAIGDLFMEVIENVAARVPYQVCAGNHDVDFFVDYNEYSKRFRMPGEFDSLVYSWNLGPVHFISINSEYYFYNTYKVEEQYLWLQQDLKEANRVRDTYPWIIVYGHTPMYCSNTYGGSCLEIDTPLRVGCPDNLCPGLEDLFFEEGVDLILWGHEHSYEASYPVYNYTIYNGSLEEPYTNPRAPVHLTTGAAGNKYGHDEYDESQPIPEWSRFRNADYTYSRMQVVNHTHLVFEQIIVPEGRMSHKAGIEILDTVTLIQENHGPFSQHKK